jgi:hypothetical protein
MTWASLKFSWNFTFLYPYVFSEIDALTKGSKCREHRIQERRRRIQERLAALRAGESTGPVREIENKQMDPGKQQSLESVRKIMALRVDTTAAVNLVPLQADAAENARRIADEKRRQEMRTKMLAEAEQSAQKNAAVAMHWADLFTIDVPQVCGGAQPCSLTTASALPGNRVECWVRCRTSEEGILAAQCVAGPLGGDSDATKSLRCDHSVEERTDSPHQEGS